ncbi:unnamed protein product [Medioppia subpectinata]|uniref:Uncharacterized protein n=1 Tax=Medioppia subpectinata TaxID=1979941 RepID=A0A7R9Q429_9ACAR|nr:unnamed protein product [Medioppia subpectinata]CAG2111947.1 unnamed protein product [Medioppia subpectinata]
MDTTYSLKAVCDVMSNLCQYITCGLVHKEDGDDSERSPLLRPSPQRTTTQPTLSNHYWEGSISGAKEVVVKQMPDEDVKQITYFSQRAAEAVRKGFQIDCNESVIVAFNP